MNYETPLDRIWKSYQITGDCLKITQRSVSKDEKSLLKGTAFINSSSKDDPEAWIEQSRTDVNDYVILSLGAAFERIILEYLQKEGRTYPDISRCQNEILASGVRPLSHILLRQLIPVFA